MLEICVEDVAGLEAAVAGGADRLEVCSALALGGLTPSSALVAHAARRGLPVRALIRPRAGGFHYGEQELALMEADIAAMLDAGAEGLVLGVADNRGELDEVVTRRLLDVAHGHAGRCVGLTLHRMIDLSPDPVSTAFQAADLGFDCVLSSGGAPKALDGAAVLARIVASAPPNLVIMAGGGVTPQTAAELLNRTGAKALHASARGRSRPSPARLAALGFAAPRSAMTSVTVVRKLNAILKSRRR